MRIFLSRLDAEVPAAGIGRETRISEYQEVDMDSTSLESLSLVPGDFIFYSHQHYCEHVLIVIDIRSYHDSLDGLFRNSFPKQTFKDRYRARKCQICEILGATIILYNDRLCEYNPCFSCG